MPNDIAITYLLYLPKRVKFVSYSNIRLMDNIRHDSGRIVSRKLKKKNACVSPKPTLKSHYSNIEKKYRS